MDVILKDASIYYHIDDLSFKILIIIYKSIALHIISFNLFILKDELQYDVVSL